MVLFLVFILIATIAFQDNCMADSDDDGFCMSLNSLNNLQLKYDEALFQIKVYPGNDVPNILLSLDGISALCYECDLLHCAEHTDFIKTKVDTNFEYRYQISGDGNIICNGSYHFQEHGQYLQYIVYNNKTQRYQCADIIQTKKHDFVYLPLVILIAIIVFLIISYNVVLYYLRRRSLKRQIGYSQISGDDSDHLSDSDSTMKYGSTAVVASTTQYSTNGVRPAGRTRIKSLDTFRGISILVMIFVNYTGGGYWFFNHSSWNGLTVADLVFPWFIFIMGSSMFISHRSLRRKHISKKKIAKNICIRSVKLLALGLFLNNGFDITTWRIPGVLQRFALSYFVVAMVNLLFSPEEDEIDTHYNYDWRDAFRDITWFPWQHLIMAILLLGYLLILFLVHDPDCPRCHQPNRTVVSNMFLLCFITTSGYLGPGGLGDHGKYPNCTGGATRYIDLKVFGYNHIYHGTTCKIWLDDNEKQNNKYKGIGIRINFHTEVVFLCIISMSKNTSYVMKMHPYECIAHDPEGLLGLIPSIILTYLGLQASRILFLFSKQSSHIKRWLFWAVVWGCIAAGLCGGTQNMGVIPVNKNLWSLSFIFATGSMAYILLIICYVLVDVLKWWSGAPFYFAGMNPIMLYVAHEVFRDYFPFGFHTNTQHSELLARAAIGASLWTFISYICYRKAIFLKL